MRQLMEDHIFDTGFGSLEKIETRMNTDFL